MFRCDRERDSVHVRCFGESSRADLAVQRNYRIMKMSKLEKFRDFIHERLSAAAVEIFGHYEKTLTECEEELRRSQKENEERLRMFQPLVLLHRSGLLLHCEITYRLA